MLSRAFDEDRWARRKAEVIERVSILDVVERVVALKALSKRSYQGLCPFHAEKTPSFTVYPEGGQKVKVGFFICYGCGAKGDVITFMMRHQQRDFKEAIEQLESENGLDYLQPAPPPKPAVAQVGDRDKLEYAYKIRRAARAIERDDPADRYLRGRALVPPADYGVGDAAVNAGWPVSLRFLPRCWHYIARREYPAVLADICAPDGTLLTVHRTYLDQKRDGSWGKAAVEKPKLVVGPYGEGYILLGPVTGEMLGGEGYESSMSAMQLWRRSGLAFVTAGRMRTVAPPFDCNDFIYAADKGGKDRAGERAAAAGAAADFNRGRRTSVRVPNLAAAEGDFNDYLQAIARGEDPTRGPEPPASTGNDTASERRSPRPALRPPDEVDREAALYEMDAGLRAAKEAERQARSRFRRAQAAQRQLRPRSKPERVTAVRDELRLAGEAWQTAKAAAVVALKNRRVVA